MIAPKSGGPASRLELRGRVCKWPVSRILSRTIIPLGGILLRRSSDLPGGFPPSRRTGIGTRVSAPGQHASAARVWPSDSLPIWSCSVWGLPCHRLYRRRGALLPHLFTLTPGDKPKAVCSLWHWPSLSLNAQIPDVIRHTALRSSDFPLPKHASASAATARRTCNVYASPYFGAMAPGNSLDTGLLRSVLKPAASSQVHP